MKRYLIVFCTVFFLASLFAPRYFIQSAQEKEIALAAVGDGPIPVKVMRMNPSTSPIEIQLPSYLDAINVTPLWARTNGYLSSFLVDIGDRVTTGQLLAIIDTPDVDEELARAEGELAALIAKESFARITAERWTKLYEYNPEALSAEDVDRTVTDYAFATADVAAARANVERLMYLQGFKYIYAPFGGVIVSRSIDIGTLITEATTELFQIARTDVLRAFVDVPQSCFYLVKDGLEAAVSVWEYPGQEFRGVIDRNAEALDPEARTLLTQVNLDNRSNELMPGLYAQVRFAFTPEQKTYLIPVGALIVRSGPPFVAVVKTGNTVHLQQVEIGRDFGTTLEIISGICEDDEVITNPTDLIREGMQVTPTPLSKEEETSLMKS
jgi:RND family efflux transporter MFP subunit